MSARVDEIVVNLPSDFKFLGAVDAAVQDLAREFAFSQDTINDVTTALIEACSNAIEHGNKFDNDKRVEVSLRFNGEGLVARITDQGAGFDFDAKLSQSGPTDPMSERGRGLMIMQAFCDSMSFSYDPKIGLSLELKKSGSDSSDSAESAE